MAAHGVGTKSQNQKRSEIKLSRKEFREMNERRFAVARELRASGSGKEKMITGYACTWLNPTSIADWDEVIP
jgi:hypothetical protein